MVNWTVNMKDEAHAELERLLSSGVITKTDIKVLLTWVDEMAEFGPDHIAASPEWHDHELEREWLGYRSSAFSSSGRIIYKVFDDEIIVKVYKVTPDHNYKK